MKTVIYCNVTTGETFDADGCLRTLNNPFTAAYGEKRLFEWHLVTAADGNVPSEWPPLTEFEYTPSIASLAADDTYINAYPGTVVSCEPGATSILLLTLKEENPPVPAKGTLRLTGTDDELIEVDYTAATAVNGNWRFQIPEQLDAALFPAGTSADLLKQPMAKVSSFLSDSIPARGIFQFSLTFQSEKLRKLFEYADLEQVPTKGLELRLAGLDQSAQRVELVRAVVPLTILGVLDPGTLPVSIPANGLSAYQSWTLALLAAGLEAAFSKDKTSWTADSTGALWFRLRPANVPGAQWCTPIPIPQPKLDPDHVEHSFTVSEGAAIETIEIPYSELNVSKPFDSSLFELQADGSELNITHNSNLQMFYTETLVRICWNGTFPPGTYILRG